MAANDCALQDSQTFLPHAPDDAAMRRHEPRHGALPPDAMGAAMTTTPRPKLPQECPDMPAVRVEIDRLDRALVDLIAERFGYVERAWEIKLAERTAANVPWRNQQVIDKVRARAEERGVSADLCEALWRQMIGWFVQYEEEKLRRKLEGQ